MSDILVLTIVFAWLLIAAIYVFRCNRSGKCVGCNGKCKQCRNEKINCTKGELSIRQNKRTANSGRKSHFKK